MIAAPPTTATSSGSEPPMIAGRTNSVRVMTDTASAPSAASPRQRGQRDDRDGEDRRQQQQRLAAILVDELVSAVAGGLLVDPIRIWSPVRTSVASLPLGDGDRELLADVGAGGLGIGDPHGGRVALVRLVAGRQRDHLAARLLGEGGVVDLDVSRRARAGTSSPRWRGSAGPGRRRRRAGPGAPPGRPCPPPRCRPPQDRDRGRDPRRGRAPISSPPPPPESGPGSPGPPLRCLAIHNSLF